MNYITTIVTQKSQVTLPKAIRDFVKIKPNSKVKVSISGDSVKISPVGPDILDLAGTFKIPKGAPGILEAREYMEKHYKRF